MHQFVFGFWRRGGIWRRWTAVFVLCVTAFICVVIINKKPSPSKESSILSTFKWLDLKNVTYLTKCRNSVQGPHLIADEIGQICRMQDVLSTGCCDVNSNTTKRFVCTSCQANRCCRVFEHCVGCCLQPRKRNVLELVLVHAQNHKNPLLRMVQDTFELCLHKCRTSSSSVQGENKYRDGLYKYCYGVDAPRVLTNGYGASVIR